MRRILIILKYTIPSVCVPAGHRLLQSPQALPNWDSFPLEVPQHPAWNDQAALWHGGLPHPEQQFAVIPGLGDPLPDPAAPLAQLEAALDETAEIAEARGKRKWMGRPAAKQRQRLACVTEVLPKLVHYV